MALKHMFLTSTGQAIGGKGGNESYTSGASYCLDGVDNFVVGSDNAHGEWDSLAELIEVCGKHEIDLATSTSASNHRPGPNREVVLDHPS